MKVNILGTDYTIKQQTQEENPKLLNANGICEFWSKEIIIDPSLPDAESFNNLKAFNQKVLRHEIIHAFFGESGLYGYMRDEVLVDWIVIQFDKIVEVFKLLSIEKLNKDEN